jgi:uncharacterized membrane protein YbhN (UPF0104 family)
MGLTVRVSKYIKQDKYHVLGVFVLLAAIVALAATIGVAWVAGWDAVLDRLRRPEPAWFAAAFGAELVAYVAYVLAYREVARVERGAELKLPQAAAIVAAGFGVFVAAGGYFVDTEALETAGIPSREAQARAMGLGALEYALLAPAAAISAGFLIWDRAPRPDAGFTWPWLIAVPVGFLAVGLALHQRPRLRQWQPLHKLSSGFHALRMVIALARKPSRHGHAFPAMAVYWFGDVACLWACLQAFGVRLPVPALIIAYATGYALSRRTLPLGGAGIVEALLPFALLWSGSPLASAVLAVFSYRFFNLWLPLLPALGSLPVLRRIEAQVQ